VASEFLDKGIRILKECCSEQLTNDFQKEVENLREILKCQNTFFENINI
jgi:hypothetical protein